MGQINSDHNSTEKEKNNLRKKLYINIDSPESKKK